MKCYVHIGTEKTGTTTIQQFFKENQKNLLQYGYYYTESLGTPNNRLLSIAAFNPSRRDDYTQILRIHSDNQLLAQQDKIREKLKGELQTIPSQTTVIFSTEHIQSRLTTTEELQKLKGFLEEVGFKEIYIIVYLRNPAEIVGSLYSTSVKAGNIPTEVPLPDNLYFNNICNHKETIKKFSSVFTNDKVIVRLFRADHFPEKSLLHDFADIIGLDFQSQKFIFPANQNESLSILGIEILKKLNAKIPKFAGSHLNPYRRNLIDFITTHYSKPKFTIDHKTYQAYESHFLDSNEWVRENYFPDEEVLFPAKNVSPSQLNLSEIELENIANSIYQVWIRQVDALNDPWYQFGKRSLKQKLKFILKKIIYPKR